MAERKFKDGPCCTTIYDRETKTKMIICINSRVRGKAGGGIRIMGDVTEKEVAQMSKTMTLKYGFLGIPMGGAKAGICTNLAPDSQERIAALKRIGKKITPFLVTRSFIPGFDMGTRPSDLEALLTGAGMAFHKSDWREVTHVYTAWSMLASIEEALKLTGGSLKNKTIAIDGFGKVGSEFALEAAKKGGKIMAIATKEGARYSKEGFDASKLAADYKKYGEAFVNKIKAGEKLEREKIALLACDIFVPCARFNPINSQNYQLVKAKIICVGHNMPLDVQAKKGLHKKGTIYLPGFVANGGGVLGGQLNGFLPDEEIKEIIYGSYAKKIRDAFSCSTKHGVAFEDYSTCISKKNFKKVKEIEESKTVLTRAMTFGISRLPKAIGLPLIQKKLKSLNFN